ncbi:Major facilitator superfamily [Macrophomina phaseolina MS6]|uniref:Major facilitator superfamily n=1 Tax=Macrophomina phaseolina (strain MS6) TaxID=1126212 RepID=K2QIA1_MACPH|nr:Major facilitator superfamily [Macrophomina phaseolina MS6]
MERGGGLATVIVTSTFFLGPAAGPVIGGYTMASRGDWRWLMWATLIGAAPVWIAALFSSETSAKHLRKKHAASAPAGCPPSATFKTLLVITLLRPLRMLVLEPIVAAFALYHAFVFGVLYAFFDGFPYIYGTVYHFRAEKAGLGFVGILVGVVLAPVTFVILGRIQQAATKNVPQSPRSPEARLYICMLSGFGIPISLFWTAWSAKRDVSWLVPMFAGIPFGWGVVCLFVSLPGENASRTKQSVGVAKQSYLKAGRSDLHCRYVWTALLCLRHGGKRPPPLHRRRRFSAFHHTDVRGAWYCLGYFSYWLCLDFPAANSICFIQIRPQTSDEKSL